MKNNLLLVILLFCYYQIDAQDWFSNDDQMFYWSKRGKVYLTPDFTSAAIYYNQNSFTPEEIARMESIINNSSDRVAQSGVIMNGKGIIQLRDLDDPLDVQLADRRENFANRFQVGATRPDLVLPAFSVQGNGTMWLTKRVNLKLKEGISIATLQNDLHEFQAEVVKSILNNRLLNVQLNNVEKQFELIHHLYDKGYLEYGSPDFKIDLVHHDPIYPNQWHLNNIGGISESIGASADQQLTEDIDIDAPEAWEITKGSDEIIVAIIDDGIDAHEDLAPLLQGYTPAANGGIGSAGFPSYDTVSHGMACGGIVAALHNNLGVRGVAPNVRLMSINIFHPNTGSFDIADGIEWAVNNGADVLSNSWGYTSCSQNLLNNVVGGGVDVVEDAFQFASENGREGLGCITLISSGNDDKDCVNFPAKLPSVIAVGAVKGNGQISEYSNGGPTLDIVAPSSEYIFNDAGDVIAIQYGIVTTDRMGFLGYNNSNYNNFFGGTSAACPQVAGVAALVLSLNPLLTKQEVEDILLSTADDMGPAGFDNNFGHGRVNAFGAVSAVLETLDPVDLSVSTQSVSYGEVYENYLNVDYVTLTNNLESQAFVTLSGTSLFQPLKTLITIPGNEMVILPIELKPDAFTSSGDIIEELVISGVDYEQIVTLSATLSTQPFSVEFQNPDVMNINSNVPAGFTPVGYQPTPGASTGFSTGDTVNLSSWFAKGGELFAWYDQDAMTSVGEPVGNGEVVDLQNTLDNKIYLADRWAKRVAIFDGQLLITGASQVTNPNQFQTKIYFNGIDFTAADASLITSNSQNVVYAIQTDDAQFEIIFFNDGYTAFSFLEIPDGEVEILFEQKNATNISSIQLSELFDENGAFSIYMSRSQIQNFNESPLISFAGVDNFYNVTLSENNQANQLLLFQTNYQGLNKYYPVLFDLEKYQNSELEIPVDITITEQAIDFGQVYENYPYAQYLTLTNNSNFQTTLSIGSSNSFQPLKNEIVLEGNETVILPIELTSTAFQSSGDVSEDLIISGVDYQQNVPIQANLSFQPFDVEFLNPNVMNVTSDIPAGLTPSGYKVASPTFAPDILEVTDKIGSSTWVAANNELFKWYDTLAINSIGEMPQNGQVVNLSGLLDNVIYLASDPANKVSIFDGQLFNTTANKVNNGTQFISKVYFDNLDFEEDDISLIESIGNKVIYSITTEQAQFQIAFLNEGYMTYSFLELPNAEIDLVFESKENGIIATVPVSEMFSEQGPYSLYISRGRIQSIEGAPIISFAGGENYYDVSINSSQEGNQFLLFQTNYEGFNQYFPVLFDQNEYEANSAPIQLESAVNGNLVFYPNPVEYELNVNWEELSSQSIVVEIRNMYSEVLSIQLLRKGDKLSMTSLPPGRYLLTVVGSEEETMSIIKR